MTEFKAAYWQLVGYVNQYQGTRFNSEYIEQVADVLSNMWDLGVQLTQSRSDVEQLRNALDRFMNTMTESNDFSLDGELDVIIDEVGNEIDSIIAELEAERQKTEAVKAVFEDFYLPDDAM